MQIPDCRPFNADSDGSGLPCRLRNEQCRTAMLRLIGAVTEQTPELGSLLRVTCDIKPESAIADDDRTAGLLPSVRK
jgi:hypothetical protein